MKALVPLVLLLAVGCSTRKPTRVVLHPKPELAGVRLPEVVGAYHLGRRVDDQDRLHEAHPLYRIEAEARWDLRPGTQGRVGIPPVLPVDPAISPAPSHDAITAELRHQQEYSARLLEEATRLAQSYSQLQDVITHMARVAREHEQVGASLRALETRQLKMEEALERLVRMPAH